MIKLCIPLLPTVQSRYAVAHHHGLATSLLDVTRDLRIAGYFASNTGRPPAPRTESCIYCFHSGRMREIAFTWRRKALDDGFAEDELDLPAHFEADVANLWRLHAQVGSFIGVPARWRRIFAVYFIPTQMVMNAQRGTSLVIYSPTLPVEVRLH